MFVVVVFRLPVMGGRGEEYRNCRRMVINTQVGRDDFFMNGGVVMRALVIRTELLICVMTRTKSSCPIPLSVDIMLGSCVYMLSMT